MHQRCQAAPGVSLGPISHPCFKLAMFPFFGSHLTYVFLHSQKNHIHVVSIYETACDSQRVDLSMSAKRTSPVRWMMHGCKCAMLGWISNLLLASLFRDASVSASTRRPHPLYLLSLLPLLALSPFSLFLSASRPTAPHRRKQH
jgi:hypothetical protein